MQSSILRTRTKLDLFSLFYSSKCLHPRQVIFLFIYPTSSNKLYEFLLTRNVISWQRISPSLCRSRIHTLRPYYSTILRKCSPYVHTYVRSSEFEPPLSRSWQLEFTVWDTKSSAALMLLASLAHSRLFHSNSKSCHLTITIVDFITRFQDKAPLSYPWLLLVRGIAFAPLAIPRSPFCARVFSKATWWFTVKIIEGNTWWNTDLDSLWMCNKAWTTSIRRILVELNREVKVTYLYYEKKWRKPRWFKGHFYYLVGCNNSSLIIEEKVLEEERKEVWVRVVVFFPVAAISWCRFGVSYCQMVASHDFQWSSGFPFPIRRFLLVFSMSNWSCSFKKPGRDNHLCFDKVMLWDYPIGSSMWLSLIGQLKTVKISFHRFKQLVSQHFEEMRFYDLKRRKHHSSSSEASSTKSNKENLICLKSYQRQLTEPPGIGRGLGGGRPPTSASSSGLEQTFVISETGKIISLYNFHHLEVTFVYKRLSL